MKQAGIYSFINLVNGKRYIGQAVDLEKRLRWHYSSLKKGYNSSIKLQRAWNKYGYQNFVVETLISTENEYPKEYLKLWLEYLEKDYIQYYDSQKNGYNCSIGGESALGCIRSKETRNKISTSLSGENHPNFGKRGKESFMWGRCHSEETKKKMRESHLGDKNASFGKKRPDTSIMNSKRTGENNPNFGRTGEKSPMWGKTPWNKGLKIKKQGE